MSFTVLIADDEAMPRDRSAGAAARGRSWGWRGWMWPSDGAEAVELARRLRRPDDGASAT